MLIETAASPITSTPNTQDPPALTPRDRELLEIYFCASALLDEAHTKHHLDLYDFTAWTKQPHIAQAIADIDAMLKARANSLTLMAAPESILRLQDTAADSCRTAEVRRRASSQLLRLAAPHLKANPSNHQPPGATELRPQSSVPSPCRCSESSQSSAKRQITSNSTTPSADASCLLASCLLPNQHAFASPIPETTTAPTFETLKRALSPRPTSGAKTSSGGMLNTCRKQPLKNAPSNHTQAKRRK